MLFAGASSWRLSISRLSVPIAGNRSSLALSTCSALPLLFSPTWRISRRKQLNAAIAFCLCLLLNAASAALTFLTRLTMWRACFSGSSSAYAFARTFSLPFAHHLSRISQRVVLRYAASIMAQQHQRAPFHRQPSPSPLHLYCVSTLAYSTFSRPHTPSHKAPLSGTALV